MVSAVLSFFEDWPSITSDFAFILWGVGGVLKKKKCWLVDESLTRVSQITASEFSNFMPPVCQMRYCEMRGIIESRMSKTNQSLKWLDFQFDNCNLLLSHIWIELWGNPDSLSWFKILEQIFCFSLLIQHHFNLSKTWQFRIQDNQNTATCSWKKM